MFIIIIIIIIWPIWYLAIFLSMFKENDQRCLKIKKIVIGPLKIKGIKLKLQYHVV